MSQKLFTGFSTIGTDVNKNWTLHDVDLIRRDLLNHFHTRLGERVMRPEYGCRIWDYLMEPNTEVNRQLIELEARRVCESDSRLSVENVSVKTFTNGLTVSIQLLYKPFDVVEDFGVNFIKNTRF